MLPAAGGASAHSDRRDLLRVRRWTCVAASAWLLAVALGEAFLSQRVVTALAAALGLAMVAVAGRVASRFVEHRQSELGVAARHSQFLQNLIDTIPNPIFYKDNQGRYLGYNKAFQRVFGYGPEELVGKSLLDMERASLDARTQWHQEQLDQIRHGGTTRREQRFEYADGRMRTTIASISAVEGPTGETGLVGAIVDVTELKEAQEEARAASEAKTTFLANMSHEIRTPMNAIIGMSHLALKTNLSPRQRDYLQKIQQSGQHLLGILNDILDLSKVEAGKLVVEHVAFELDRVLDMACDVVADKAAATGLALVRDVATDVPRQLVGDPMRLTQVLINFAANAIKFTQQGEVRMVVRVVQHLPAAAPNSTSVEAQAMLRFEVRDTGIGIHADKIGRLFQNFEQADSSTTRQYGGTGLGLSISKKLAELMGGAVGVDSVPGVGSSFWFTARIGIGANRGNIYREREERGLPARQCSAARAALDGSQAGSGAYGALIVLRGARILLVEDNELNQQVATELLVDAGFDVTVAQDGAVALRLLQSAASPYELVLMDMQMPVMDGVTATRAIRLDPRHDAMPILAMTANALPADLQRCIDAGMQGYVTKPVDPDALWRALAGHLRQRQPPRPPARDSSPASANRATDADVVLFAGLCSIPTLDTAIGLRRSMGKLSLYLKLLRTFLEGQHDATAKITFAISMQDWSRAERLTHTLKSVAGSIGALTLQDQAAWLEQGLRAQARANELNARIRDTATALRATVEALRVALPQDTDIIDAIAITDQPTRHDSAAHAHWQAMAMRLDELLLDDDACASDLLSDNLRTFVQWLGPEGSRRLVAAVTRFDFDHAHRVLHEAEVVS